MPEHPSQPRCDASGERRVAFAMLARAALRHRDRVQALLASDDVTAAAARLESTWSESAGLRESASSDLDLAAEIGARLITTDDAEWPHEQFTVARTAGAIVPIALWARGAAPLSTFTGRAVAVVGTRCATRYGTDVAAEFTDELARLGYPVMTAADGGIATAAHRRALHAQTPTLAVTTTDIAAARPGADTALLDQTTRHGLVVSLHAPYASTASDALPVRNELMNRHGLGTASS